MISCNIDNKEDGRLANHESQNIVNSFILNDDIIREFNKYVDEMNFDNSVIYAIEFLLKINMAILIHLIHLLTFHLIIVIGIQKAIKVYY